jgi:hypothetical protein
MNILFKFGSIVDAITLLPLNFLFEFDEMYPELRNKNVGIKLSIRNTGILEMDEHVMHPFVRIHIVDLITNKYLAKSNEKVPGVANLENCSFFSLGGENFENKLPKMISTDFFLPMSTSMYDLRVKG